MEQFTLHFRELDGRSSQELARYRELGTVESLMRTKFQEQQRLRRRKIAKKISDYLLDIFVGTMFIWGIASWADIVMHNTLPNPVYQWWNLIVLVCDIMTPIFS